MLKHFRLEDFGTNKIIDLKVLFKLRPLDN